MTNLYRSYEAKEISTVAQLFGHRDQQANDQFASVILHRMAHLLRDAYANEDIMDAPDDLLLSIADQLDVKTQRQRLYASEILNAYQKTREQKPDPMHALIAAIEEIQVQYYNPDYRIDDCIQHIKDVVAGLRTFIDLATKDSL